MNTTPRIDSLSFIVRHPTPYDPHATECITAHHARQLETELHAERAHADRLAEALGKVNEWTMAGWSSQKEYEVMRDATRQALTAHESRREETP